MTNKNDAVLDFLERKGAWIDAAFVSIHLRCTLKEAERALSLVAAKHNGRRVEIRIPGPLSLLVRHKRTEKTQGGRCKRCGIDISESMRARICSPCWLGSDRDHMNTRAERISDAVFKRRGKRG